MGGISSSLGKLVLTHYEELGHVFLPAYLSRNTYGDSLVSMYPNTCPPCHHLYAQVPPVHYKYYEDDLQANLNSEINPFPLHSEWVDREVKVGNIDEHVSVGLLVNYRNSLGIQAESRG